MRIAAAWARFLVVAAGIALPAGAYAQSVSIGVQTNNLQLGINLGPTPPPLAVVPAPAVAVPGPPVYYAPGVAYNYFVYRNVYYLFRDGRWFRARHYGGPWVAIAIAHVPRPILAVPVDFYRERPARWARHGPPPWAHERTREHRWEKDHGRGRERG